MNTLRVISTAIAVTFSLGGCALFGEETGYRSIRIENHQLRPAEIGVPAGRGFILNMDAFDSEDLVISAPDLGITRLRIPASPKDFSPMTTDRIVPTRHATLPLGPLKQGRYMISCDCHGHPTTAIVVAR
jgi:hypothetical protein